MSGAAAGLAAPAQPLEAGVRDQLSAHFGHDFSAVRVHVGPEADAAARSLDAKAYTVGNDVVFSHGAYDPLTGSGRSLIAHELAHVAQHGGRAHAPNFLARPGARLPSASASLERQADLAAALADRPLPRAWAWERATAPFLGRAEAGWTPFTVTYVNQPREIKAVERPPEEPTAVVVDLGAFVLPKEKGPWAEHYDAIAKARGLQATMDVSGHRIRTGLWQKRAQTQELRRLWLQRVQWPADRAQRWWHEAGGDAPGTREFNPKTKGRAAQIDHIVELQLGGTNVPENLAPHDGHDNEESGRKIWLDVSRAAAEVLTVLKAHPEDGPVNSLTLRFSSAVQPEPYTGAEPLSPLPAAEKARPAVIASRAGEADRALQVHFTALNDLKAGTRPDAAEREAAAAELAARTPYPVKAGPSTATLRVTPAISGEDPIEGDTVNESARELISGVVLEKLKRTPDHRRDEITAWLNSAEHPVRSRSRLPIAIKDHHEKLQLSVTDVGNTGKLELKGGTNRVRFAYPYLSAGEMTLRMTDTGLVGRGRITPTVPLLSRVPIDVTLDQDGLHGSVTAPKEKLSLPPFKITDASLNVSLGTPLSAGGHLGLELGRIVTADLDVGADTSGLFAKGRARAKVPGLDEVAGEIVYRPHGGLSGHLVAGASRAGGLVRGGSVSIDFADRAWRASGDIKLMLPGDNPVDLHVVTRKDRIVYSGQTKLKVPGLKEVDFDLSYDGEHVSGTGHTAFTILGMDGTITVGYREGRFTGKGTAELKHGRVSGGIVVVLDDHGRISGKGSASLELRPGLVGKAAVLLSPDQRLRVEGELRFPPYRFLDPRSSRYDLFRYRLPEIPLFAIPLGPTSIGLVAVISAGMAASYGFGPGEFHDMVIKAGFNPLERDTNLELEAQARLSIPAHAGLELSLRAGVGLSVAVGSVTGGITVTGGVMLRGGLDAGVHLKYARQLLVFDADAKISVKPVLTLAIDADILAKAVLVGEHRWAWQLAAYKYDTGLEFGMIAPFHYQSDQPLRLPEAKDIKWIVPDIDAKALTHSIGGKVRAGLGL